MFSGAIPCGWCWKAESTPSNDLIICEARDKGHKCLIGLHVKCCDPPRTDPQPVGVGESWYCCDGCKTAARRGKDINSSDDTKCKWLQNGRKATAAELTKAQAGAGAQGGMDA